MMNYRLAKMKRFCQAMLVVLVIVLGSAMVLTLPATATIYVGNVSYETGKDDLKQVFAEYGSVKSIQIPIERVSGRMKGFAFVEMGSEAEESTAIEALAGTELMGRKLIVKNAKPKPDRDFNGGRWGNNTGGGSSYGGQGSDRLPI